MPVSFVPWLLAWLLAAGVVVVARRYSRLPSSGLVVAYLASLFVIHWVGAAVYVLPGYRPLHSPDTVLSGFQQSVYAVGAFAVGSLLLAPRILRGRPAAGANAPSASGGQIASPGGVSLLPDWGSTASVAKLALLYLGIGAAAFVGLLTLLGKVNTVTALVAAAQQLFPLGLCLLCWVSWRSGHKRLLLVWLGVAMLIPLVTISYEGFASFGVAATLVVLSFASSLSRARLMWLVAFILLVFLGLSFFVTYFRDRNQIRQVVWTGQGYATRFEQLQTTFIRGFQWFDIGDTRSVRSIDSRLNQNYLIAAAASRLDANGNYAGGETLVDAAISLVPRALWPDKPVSAGSPGLVTRFTGIQFAPGTTVGIGHVMEFYVNFGTIGVIAGFILLGCILTLLDVRAAQRLRRGDQRGFALLFLVGVSLLQVEGSFVDATATAAASAVVVVVIHFLLGLRRKRSLAMPRESRRPLGHVSAPATVGD
jgi:hypothetical protein